MCTTSTRTNMSSTSSSTQTTKTFVSNYQHRKIYPIPAMTMDHAPLEAVYIYFDTATYDEIERDEKVAFYLLDCKFT